MHKIPLSHYSNCFFVVKKAAKQPAYVKLKLPDQEYFRLYPKNILLCPSLFLSPLQSFK